jgi:uncharacterized membrane protein
MLLTSSSNNHVPAFFYENGKITNLGTLGAHDVWAFAVDESGAIYGQLEKGDAARTYGDSFHIVTWTSSGKLTDLGTFGGTDATDGDINDAGAIVGRASNADGSDTLFVYANGVQKNFKPIGTGFTYQMHLDNAGDVVGYTNVTDAIEDIGNTIGWIYTAAGELKNMNDMRPGFHVTPEDINAQGDIVGVWRRILILQMRARSSPWWASSMISTG